MAQAWVDMLFAHWALPRAALRRFVPPGLDLDTFEGSAWLGVTAFVVGGARLRGLPAMPVVSTFAEVNVRTYVTSGDRPGVLFLSLDAASLPAVLGARVWYRLPYYFTAGKTRWTDGRVIYGSRRRHPRAPAAVFEAEYRPVGVVEQPVAEPLARWLTERYCLYTYADGRLLRAEIHHAPWPIQRVEASIRHNSMAEAAGVALPAAPDATHFSAGVQAFIWPPREVRRSGAAAGYTSGS
jgi:uncharacterized protein